jgi:hypothetical protein
MDFSDVSSPNGPPPPLPPRPNQPMAGGQFGGYSGFGVQSGFPQYGSWRPNSYGVSNSYSPGYSPYGNSYSPYGGQPYGEPYAGKTSVNY